MGYHVIVSASLKLWCYCR